MPQPTIQIGDRLSRRSRPQYQFSKSLFKNGIDPRPPMIAAIDSAIVEGVSDGGWWVVAPNGEQYHVSRFASKIEIRLLSPRLPSPQLGSSLLNPTQPNLKSLGYVWGFSL